MFRIKNYSGGNGNHNTDMVLTAQRNYNAENRLRYITYDMFKLRDIRAMYGDYWCDIVQFVLEELLSHVNITNKNFTHKGRVLGYGQVYFSTLYIVKNVDGSKDRFLNRFGEKNDTKIRNETRKALKIIQEFNIADKVGDIVTVFDIPQQKTESENIIPFRRLQMAKNFKAVNFLLNHFGFYKRPNETIEEAIARFIQWYDGDAMVN